MMEHLAGEQLVEPAWVDVSFPLYYWANEQTPETLTANPGLAKTYVSLAKALAVGLLLKSKTNRTGRDRTERPWDETA